MGDSIIEKPWRMDNTFDRLLSERPLNDKKPNLMQACNVSLTNIVQSPVASRPVYNTRSKKKFKAPNAFVLQAKEKSRERTLDKSVNESLWIEKVPRFVLPKITFSSSSSTSNIRLDGSAAKQEQGNCNSKQDKLRNIYCENYFSTTFQKRSHVKMHIASTPAVTASTPNMSQMINETMSPIVSPTLQEDSYKVNPKANDKLFKKVLNSTPIVKRKRRPMNLGKRVKEIKSDNSSSLLVGKKAKKSKVVNIYDAGSDWKFMVQPQVILDRSLDVIGISRSVRLDASLLGFSNSQDTSSISVHEISSIFEHQLFALAARNAPQYQDSRSKRKQKLTQLELSNGRRELVNKNNTKLSIADFTNNSGNCRSGKESLLMSTSQFAPSLEIIQNSTDHCTEIIEILSDDSTSIDMPNIQKTNVIENNVKNPNENSKLKSEKYLSDEDLFSYYTTCNSSVESHCSVNMSNHSKSDCIYGKIKDKSLKDSNTNVIKISSQLITTNTSGVWRISKHATSAISEYEHTESNNDLECNNSNRSVPSGLELDSQGSILEHATSAINEFEHAESDNDLECNNSNRSVPSGLELDSQGSILEHATSAINEFEHAESDNDLECNNSNRSVPSGLELDSQGSILEHATSAINEFEHAESDNDLECNNSNRSVPSGLELDCQGSILEHATSGISEYEHTESNNDLECNNSNRSVPSGLELDSQGSILEHATSAINEFEHAESDNDLECNNSNRSVPSGLELDCQGSILEHATSGISEYEHTESNNDLECNNSNRSVPTGLEVDCQGSILEHATSAISEFEHTKSDNNLECNNSNRLVPTGLEVDCQGSILEHATSAISEFQHAESDNDLECNNANRPASSRLELDCQGSKTNQTSDEQTITDHEESNAENKGAQMLDFKKPESIILKPGKSWRRTLLAHKRLSITGLLERSVNKVEGESCSCSQYPPKEESSVPDRPTQNRRLSIKVIPEFPNYFIRTNASILENYASSHFNTISPNDSIYWEKSIGEPLLQRTKSIHEPSPVIQPTLTARDIVLRRCEQTEPLPFEQCFPPSTLRNCFKIGEGVFGEVFLFRNQTGGRSVLKIIPIEGNQLVNKEPQKKFEEIISEIIIATELSNLRTNKKNKTTGFSEVRKITCVQGRYPERLLYLWELFDESRQSENDTPAMFEDDQLYIILELQYGGDDLERFQFKNALQAFSVFKQISCALAVAESSLQFEHRDLHWGNVLISQTDETDHTYCLDGREFQIPTDGITAFVIDFTLSRITYDGVCIFNDLSLDPDLFLASGDYQYEIYKLMKNHNSNEWKHFRPYTNVLWLHYLLDKMVSRNVNALRYKNVKSVAHKSMMVKLRKLKNRLLEYESASDLVNSEFLL